MHVALLFPPVTDPRSPHLALPSLAAYLRRAGVHTTMRDLDLEALLALLQPTSVAAAVRACEGRLGRATEGGDRSRLRAALADADFVVDHIGAAPGLLRDPEAFYQSYVFDEARRCISRALEIISVAAGPVHYGIHPGQYAVDGVDATRLRDLAAVTSDPRANLFQGFYQERLLPELERDRPDLVAVSILNFAQVIPGLTLARLLKQTGHFVVIGGTLYSKFVPQLRERPEFFRLFCDGLIAYEGETALLALIEQLAGRRDFPAVPNYLHLDARGQVVMGRQHAEDVNALPTPDFDGLPLDQYLAPAPVLPILLGKGCYFNRCKFCDIPYINKVAGKAYRLRSLDRVAEDVATLQRSYGARHFEITDEALAPKVLLRLGDALRSYPEVEARFVGYARLEPGFTPEVCERLYEMGMRKLFFGLESGSQATLDHMDKGIRLEDAPKVLRNCADAAIAFHVFSIVGFPEENEERARETLQFFLENRSTIDLPRNSFDIHPFGLDLRTDYADNASGFGLEIDAGELAARDFPLGPPRWRNAHGLEEADVERLLAEFHAELLRAYPTYRQYQGSLWPGFEEYALLYADYYERRPFGFRLTLPPAGDPIAFRLLWAPSVRVEAVDGGYHVHSLSGETVISQAALSVLAQPSPPMAVDALLQVLAEQLSSSSSQDGRRLVAELRPVIDDLLQVGALQLHPFSAPLAGEG